MAENDSIIQQAAAEHAAGHLEQATRLYRQVLANNPANAAALTGLGQCLVASGQYQQAWQSYRAAIHHAPDDYAAYYHLGRLLLLGNRYEEGLKAALKANELKADNPQVLALLGELYSKCGKYGQATESLRRALDLQPDFDQARLKLSEALFFGFNFTEAENQLRQLVNHDTEIARAAWNGLGILQRRRGHFSAAADCFEQALALDPSFQGARQNLLFMLAYYAMKTPREVLEAHRQWNRIIDGETKQHHYAWPRRHDCNDDRSRKLKIAYISPDLKMHPVGFLLEPILANHDHDAFEIHVYSGVTVADELTDRLRQHADHWHQTTNLDDSSLADRIHHDGIDVLVDLSGHNNGNRLTALACRPAPVQATYLGYCATTGLSAMDYWITDACLHPADSEELASESIYRLPRCWLACRPDSMLPAINERDSASVCFGSFNAVGKLTNEVCATWSEILKAVDDSRLLLKCREFHEPQVRQQVMAMFADNGIRPQRIELQPAEDTYLQAYHDVDIALDPFPRTGGATTLDALWMGIPVITLSGRRFIERQGHSIVSALGHEEWIAHSTEDYIDKAAGLAADPAQRRKLRAGLRQEYIKSPLYNGETLARALEAAYRDMWTRYIEKSCK